jgi:selenocysteine-specific elongation factor
VLERPIAAAVGDRFVLRDTSGSRTIGGGRFLDLRAPHRRRRTPARRAQLDALAHEDPGTALAASLDRWPFFVDLSGFARDRALSDEQMGAVLQAVPHVRTSVANDTVALSLGSWKRLADSARAALDSFHRVHPELPGLSLVQLAAAVEPRLPSRICASVVRALVEAGTLASESGAIRAPEHRFGLDVRDQRLWQRIAPWLSEADRFRPPRASELAALFKEPEAEVRRVLKAMARKREVVELARDRFFRRETVDEMAAIAVDVARAQKNGQFSVAQFRDRLDNGRKVAIQILEYFDGQGLTVRGGDLRRINPRRLDLLPLTV